MLAQPAVQRALQVMTTCHHQSPMVAGAAWRETQQGCKIPQCLEALPCSHICMSAAERAARRADCKLERQLAAALQETLVHAADMDHLKQLPGILLSQPVDG